MEHKHDVIWDTPSQDSSGSMPIGNGDIGLNVWVEKTGDLLMLIGKTDAWDENGRLIKLGKVRVKASSSVPGRIETFQQRLHLSTGEITVSIGSPGEQIRYRIWVDAHQNVVHLESEADRKLNLQVINEPWRMEARELTGNEVHSAYGVTRGPKPVIVDPDVICAAEMDNSLLWYHQNERSVWPENMKLQGLPTEDGTFRDPLLYRTSGVMVKSSGMSRVSLKELGGVEPSLQWHVQIYALCDQTDSSEEWKQQMKSFAESCDSKPIEACRENHRSWWRAFWERSWIVSDDERLQNVLQGYVLQRYLHACGGRGAFPIKFNGSIFTMELDYEDSNMGRLCYDADYRRWGGPYWFQNTRLIYWSMLASGDFDLMKPFFKMYLDALPLALLRTKLYYGHDGAYFPETVNFWGTYANDNYGWNREGREPGDVENIYIRHYVQGGLELLFLFLKYGAFSQDKAFMEMYVQPLAKAILDFYDQHYSRDANGKLRIEPASALETWSEAVNPLADIAGLHCILDLLLTGDLIEEEALLSEWRRLRNELPAIPVSEESNGTQLLPASQVIGPIQNAENPELYGIFPYPLYAVGTPSLEIGKRSYAARRVKKTLGWHQDPIQAAYLGLADEALRDISLNFSDTCKLCRFQAFWGPSYDWVPDQDNGSSAMIALQSMLIQSRGERIFILPAWPQDINIAFKLYAESGTVIEAEYRNGKLVSCSAEPPARTKDIVLGPMTGGAERTT